MESLRNIDLNLLVVLDALLRERSITTAARALRLSPPATSHALRRLRETLGDPLLVRTGQTMSTTPRAEALRPEVLRFMETARRVLRPAEAFDAARWRGPVTIHATDHILSILGPELDRRLAAGAPELEVAFLPNQPDDAERLGRGTIDLALGVYGREPEVARAALFEDRFCCVVRAEHPVRRMTLARFVELDHVLVAPRGRPGAAVDRALAERGLARRVKRRLPYFLQALTLVAETDYVLTVSERLARARAARFGLRLMKHPLSLPRYAIHMTWHVRHESDPAHTWLRSVVSEVAGFAAPPLRP